MNSKIQKRVLKLQKIAFRNERKKRKALDELRQIIGASFAAAIESLATNERDFCSTCDEPRELGESGTCVECYENQTEVTHGSER